SVFGKRVPVEAAAQVSLVSLRVVRAALGESHALVAGQVRNDRLGHVRRDGIFEAQHVSKLFVELPGPLRGAVYHAEQLNRDADAFLDPPDTAIQHKSNAELAAGDNRIVVAAITQHAVRRPNCKAADRAQSSYEGIGQSGAKIVRTGVA